jgi:hypothetical protein
MAVSFSKPTDTSVEIFWSFGDIETCGTFFSYRYTYTLKKNGSSFSVVGPTTTVGNTWTFLETGTYTVEVLVEQFDDTPAWVTCQNYIHSGSQNINTAFCIPSGATNIKFSDLAIHYGVPPGEIRLSGPNNPSTGANIFGQSGLPATGTISRTIANAVSELRNHCGGGVDNFNGWTASLKFSSSSFTTALGGFVVFGNYVVEWKNISTGAVQTTCPLNSSSVTFLCSVEVISPYSTSLLAPSPYSVRILRNDTVVHTTSRASHSVGKTSNSFVCTLSAGQSVIFQTMSQEEVLGGTCDSVMIINMSGEITAVNAGGTARPAVFPNYRSYMFVYEANPCTAPPATTSYFRYTGKLTENFNCGFKVDGSNGLVNTLRPYPSGENFVSCADFINQRSEIIQSNTTASVETAGPKSIKIGFTTLNLQITLTGTVTVRRLSDNVVLATATLNRSPGTNLYSNTTALTWSNAVSNTKIGVEVDVVQACIG